ncbi:MAG: hypothetical protein ACTSU5_11050 [Promethearchaeota archaeon]
MGSLKYELNLWSELVKYDYLLPVIPELGSYEVGLHLAVRPDKIRGLREVLKACDVASVPVTLWPLLSRKQGYWVNAWNLGAQEEWISHLLARFNPERFALDLESPINFKGIRGAVKNRKMIERTSPHDTRVRLEALVERIHDSGFRVLSTSLFTNPSWNARRGCPRPRNGDVYSYMIYTSFFQRFASEETLDNVVYHCARKIVEGHGRDSGAIDLGLTSPGVVRVAKFLGLSGLARVKSEISVALYAGIRKVHVFALDGFVPDIRKWLAATRDLGPKRPPVLETGHGGAVYRLFKKVLFKESLDLPQ